MVKNEAHIRSILQTVCDPEIPVLSIIELGILKEINQTDSALEIVITPTYNGCPAMKVFEFDIAAALQENGYKNVTIKVSLTPPWSSDLITPEGKKKLLDYGIAPPQTKACQADKKPISCPRCGSKKTEMLSEFGSTACKSLYRCQSCLEPFDYFKCY